MPSLDIVIQGVVQMVRNQEHRLARTVLVLAAGALVLSMILASIPASAGPHPKTIRGYVRDSVGNLLADAYVTVNIRYAATNTTRATGDYTTGSDGWYSVSFSSGDWDEDDIIEVISDLDGAQCKAYDVATIQSVPDIQLVDVTYPYEIPEFGESASPLPIGFLVAGFSMGVVAAAFLLVKRKS
ncbi:MAG TPA: carboxypeptidase-like regulatory domain-containing protein [Thermoplasmata archaeon]